MLDIVMILIWLHLMVNVIDLLEIEKQDVNYCYQHKNLFYVDISASWIGIITKERLLSLKKQIFGLACLFLQKRTILMKKICLRSCYVLDCQMK